ncbi:Kinesin-related motor protein [Malassezia pachydermatis]
MSRPAPQGRSVSASHMADERKRGVEASMRVLVRVRGTAPREESVFETEGTQGTCLTVVSETPATSTSRAVPRSKTYSFDRVFSAEADQNMVYTDAMSVMLNDVLLGYNCTVFAYGQTGTGKTHTMEGDLSSYMETFAPEAGVIPRTLYRLFHVLDVRGDDFAVKMSLVELYNEELRDLLRDEASSSSHSQLRMFDDTRGRGVVLQGLEEVPLVSAEHGLRLLQQGSMRRHTASTRCNDVSSRSHCVVTFTVQVKETGLHGEELMRTGKMNLVDLAGSESIGRSGAENKRAREAGHINQSLLTLGRVINALVDGSAHIPYRESRLTRMLQDSLGGRAKTCIIATVSDDRANLEETLSTLDYASRAKSIKNRPEANQRVTRAALLREYVQEIDQLRSDLAATRTKQGIYISEENWARMEKEKAALHRHIDEQKRAADVAASQLASLQEQLEQNTRVLAKRDADAAQMEAAHATRLQDLEQALSHAAHLSEQLQEETKLHHAHAASEKQLNHVAHELRQLAEQATADVHGLFAKLERRTNADQHTHQALAHFSQQLREARQRVDASAKTDIPRALTRMMQTWGEEQGALEQALQERLLSLTPSLDAAMLTDVRTSLHSMITSHMQSLHEQHSASLHALVQAAETQAADLTSLENAYEAATQAWSQHLRAMEQGYESMACRQRRNAETWASTQATQKEAWHAYEAAMAAQAEAVQRALSTFVDTHAQQSRTLASKLHDEASTEAWHASMAYADDVHTQLLSQARTAMATPYQAWDDAWHAVHASAASSHRALASHHDVLETTVPSTSKHMHHALDEALAPVQAQYDTAYNAAEAASHMAEHVQQALAAMDVTSAAADVVSDATHAHQRMQAAASSMAELERAFVPLAAPALASTGETPQRRPPARLPTWGTVPPNRQEALSWWDRAQGAVTPLQERQPNIASSASSPSPASSTPVKTPTRTATQPSLRKGPIAPRTHVPNTRRGMPPTSTPRT